MCDDASCGKDVTAGMITTYLAVQRRFANLSYWKIMANCEPWETFATDPIFGGINWVLLYRGMTGWGIDDITRDWATTVGASGCGTLPSCKFTARVEGKCYYGWDMNYAAFGWIFRLCELPRHLMTEEIVAWNLLKPWDEPIPKYDFAVAGYSGWPSAVTPLPTPSPKYGSCHTCGQTHDSDLFSEWPHYNWNYVY